MYQAVELNVNGRLIRGVVRAPEGEGPFPAVIFHHGFNVEKVGLMRLHELFSRECVKAGFACIRFDFYGLGESDGDFSDMTIGTELEAVSYTHLIGASEVSINGQKIVFLDTPGHEAFTAMRARGAHVTDIAVLVVAADDSVKPQTVESISHAKAAGVPLIVAINKIDKPGANPDRVKQDLTEHGILVEDWGGDVISVPVSAKTGDGIVNLLEMILLQAEVLELKANPNRLAMGSVIEARLDKNKGPVATLLVTNGTLKSGMSVVAGTSSGRIRLMTNYKGDVIKKAGPATAVEILGLTDVPEAGDEFNAVKEDKIAREIAENRKSKLRDEILARNASTTLEQLFSQIQEGETKDLNLIIKGDVQGLSLIHIL